MARRNPVNFRKHWDLDAARRAYSVYNDPSLNEIEKVTVFRNLGRTYGAIKTMVSAVNIAYMHLQDHGTPHNSVTGWSSRELFELEYVMGKIDRLVRPKPVFAAPQAPSQPIEIVEPKAPVGIMESVQDSILNLAIEVENLSRKVNAIGMVLMKVGGAEIPSREVQKVLTEAFGKE